LWFGLCCVNHALRATATLHYPSGERRRREQMRVLGMGRNFA
jgi:hypothetical protein